VGFFASFRSTGGSQTGVLLRAEKAGRGMKGIYMSLTEGDVAAYRLWTRKARNFRGRSSGDGQMWLAPPAGATAAGRGAPEAATEWNFAKPCLKRL
jgi:hypothetical protein